MANHSVNFDVCTDALTDTLKELTEFLVYPDDSRVKIEVIYWGPAGGNPNVQVTNLSQLTYLKVASWLHSFHMTWTDETGKLYESN